MLIYKNLPLPFSTGEEEMPSSLLSPKYAFFHLSSYSRLRSVFSISPLSLGPALSAPICLGNTFLIFSVLAPNRPPGVPASTTNKHLNWKISDDCPFIPPSTRYVSDEALVSEISLKTENRFGCPAEYFRCIYSHRKLAAYGIFILPNAFHFRVYKLDGWFTQWMYPVGHLFHCV